MIGDANTGKTSLLVKFADGKFDNDQHCTIGIDFKMKKIKLDKKVCKF